MDFLNKIGKKASETYQFTKEKTTKISGELKLRGKMSDIRDKIDETYKEIGAIIYSEIKTGTEISKEEISSKCDEITKLFEDLEKSEAEILSLKNVKKCGSCKEEIDAEVEFCPKCGKEQPKAEKMTVEVEEKELENVKEAEVVNIVNVEEDVSKVESSDEVINLGETTDSDNE